MCACGYYSIMYDKAPALSVLLCDKAGALSYVDKATSLSYLPHNHPRQRHTYPYPDNQFRQDLSQYHVANRILPGKCDRYEDCAVQYNPHQRTNRTPRQQRMRMPFQKREEPAVEYAAHKERREARDDDSRGGAEDRAEGVVVGEELRGGINAAM